MANHRTACGLFAALVLAGAVAASICVHAAPSKNPLVGTWRGNVHWFYQGTKALPATVTYSFRADGTMRSTVAVGKDAPIAREGAYVFKGARLHMDSPGDVPSDCRVKVAGRKLLVSWPGQPKDETLVRIKG